MKHSLNPSGGLQVRQTNRLLLLDEGVSRALARTAGLRLPSRPVSRQSVVPGHLGAQLVIIRHGEQLAVTLPELLVHLLSWWFEYIEPTS